jgi:hypothetical protein
MRDCFGSCGTMPFVLIGAVSIQNNAQDTQFTGDNQSVWNKELPH